VRKMLVALAVLVLAVVALTGCGETAADSAEPAPDGGQEVTTEGATTTEEVNAEVYEDCRAQLGIFIERLGELDSRLDIGLNYDEYGDQVADINVAYDDIPVGTLAYECVNRAGVPAEKALNKYVDAYNVWDRCFGDIDCDLDSIEPKLQRHWSAASQAAERAETGLESLRR
jgi:hypothetical protein